jgi:signal transduction histidine kinase
MRERADELGGQLTISSDQCGTVVHARLPVPEAR